MRSQLLWRCHAIIKGKSSQTTVSEGQRYNNLKKRSLIQIKSSRKKKQEMKTNYKILHGRKEKKKK